MGRLSDVAHGLASGQPCSPSGEPDWQPADPSLVSERSPCVLVHSAAPSAARKEAPVAESPLLEELSQCEQEIALAAERLDDPGLNPWVRRLTLLVAEARATSHSGPSRVGGAPARGPVPVEQRVLFVRSGAHVFGIVEDAVQSVHRLSAEEANHQIEMAFGAKVFRQPDRLLPLIHLSEVLHEPLPSPGSGAMQIVRVSLGEQPFGLVVDEVLGFEHALVTSLHSALRKVGLYLGASLKADGARALILDIPGVATKGGMLRLSMLPTALSNEQELST
jgi:hypothetical protein